MDIGDPSEIPTTRKALPSMQELGAFDLEPTGTPSLGPTTSKPNPAPPRPTSQQLRAAIERADPATRKKLLRLIAGGRTVEQADGKGVAATSVQPHRLSMSMRRPAPQNGDPTADSSRSSAKPGQQPAKATATAVGQTLLKIDANTDLLDVAPALPNIEQRKAALQAQLTAARSQEPRRSEAASAHKVLFPAYDPREHGDDVRRPARRGEAPVEGHFPAPRQPFQARYQHADGRPMNEEETKVEAVLQEARCEQTLEVLARDGVNGLLLSPRDLDAAVENGTLDEPTATLLWKTWSALRPVIHVIDDHPVPKQIETTHATAEVGDTQACAPSMPSLEGAVDAEIQADVATASVPVADNVPPAQPDCQTIEPLRLQASAGDVSTAEAIRTAATPTAVNAPPEPAPRNVTTDRVDQAADIGQLPMPGRKQRSMMMLRQLLRGLVALCILNSSAQLVTWAWLRWGHWLVG